MTTSELESLVRGFEDCTLPFDAWTHRAHLSVAVWYLFHFPREEATERIRAGIQRYNASLGRAAGYHETITLSWVMILSNFLDESPTASSAEELATEAARRFGTTDFLLRYFSKERLFGELARQEWVEPDLASLGSAGL